MWRARGKREVCTGCWWENLRERGHWGAPDVDVRVILMWIFRKLRGLWRLDGDGSGWRTLVSTVKKLRVP
jgi:hypothetical protein